MNEAHHQAIAEGAARAIREFLDGLLCEPLTVAELASMYGIGRNKMASVLAAMPDAERVGNRWRVPVRRLPARQAAEIFHGYAP